MDLNAKFVGAMVGAALGDAIGEVAFQRTRKERLLAQIERLDTLTYTDDTAMAIALADHLTAIGDVNGQRLGDTFREHFEREPWRGYGPGPPAIFVRVAQSGIPYEAAARTLYNGQGSLGNGAAMRITPLALFFYDADALAEKARASAVVTHTHPVGIDGAVFQARAVTSAISRDPAENFDVVGFVEDLILFARTLEMRVKLEHVRTLIQGEASFAEAAQRLGLSVAVHESMPFALYCFLRHANDYRECLFAAILNGGDRDTMGAMAGAISGAYLGSDVIPSRWRNKLESRHAIETLAHRLLACRGVS